MVRDRRAVSRALEVHDLLVKNGAVLVHELHELAKPTLVAELALLACPVVRHDDREARVQERELATPRRHYLEIKLSLFEDFGVRQERSFVPTLLSFPRGLDLRLRNSSIVALRVDDTVASDLDLAPLRERIDDGDAARSSRPQEPTSSLWRACRPGCRDRCPRPRRCRPCGAQL